MHMLSAHNRDEFLAVPQLIRFDYSAGRDGQEPTVLIKGSTLLIKYIVLGARMQLAFAPCEGRLLYALRVFDDDNDGGILWSVAERQEELDAIRGLAQAQPLVAFLFNEIAVNVAWNDCPPLETSARLTNLVEGASLGVVDHRAIKGKATKLLDKLGSSDGASVDWMILEIGGRSDWKPLRNHFITAAASSSLIDVFDQDEGNQQEQIGIWLTDSLHPSGAYHSPQRPYKENETRELTDILLSYDFGATLIESKTLSILAREPLPSRAKLQRDVSSHIDKAFKQLRGGIRKLKEGVEITDRDGKVISISRDKPAHAIVLVPDLYLIEDPQKYGLEFIKSFVAETGSFAHLLDISELLRVVQAAEMLAARGETTTPMMAFDYYLIERAKKAANAGTLCIEVLLRFVEE
ncbi:SGNH/GDSL hydrolase family protein [Tropicimonas sp. IMCC34043]|uniref:SGNH/GDSL hydrolase family protein n=1 Tax=Tropicimonas sp. IMCC34043 TaxID=2248760 RepID=UPI000E229724|nr:SGNH/GDSL hydrolase family protein [Tropicimonas sp. IMCC34043]